MKKLVITIALVVASTGAFAHGWHGGYHHHGWHGGYHHYHGGYWGRGGCNFWPGFVGGVVGGVVGTPSAVYADAPAVPVVQRQPVWVEGRYVDQVQANGSTVRIWQPGHYE